MNGLQGVIRGGLGPLIEQALAARVRAGPAAAEPTPPVEQLPAPAEVLPVTKPVGESGASIRTLSVHNSFLRMFLMESSHLPAQVRAAGGADRVLTQDVRLRVMVLPGGAPMAVGGSTATSARDESGRQRTMQELAYVSFLRQFTAGSAGAAMGAGTQTMPLLERDGDSMLDARRVLDDRATLLGAALDPLAGLLRALSPAALSTMAAELGRLAGALGGLAARFAELARPETFAAVRATSSSPLFVRVEAGPSAAPGTYQVEVVRAARGQSIRSDAVAPGAMNLAGSFKVNGATIAVGAADALFDLAARINRGEDANGNGQLDPGEDANGNGRLDGGTREHGVRASFYENRLELLTAPGGGEVGLEDPDGILRAIGLVRLDGRGQLVYAHELQPAQDAAVRVAGREFRSADNVFTDAAPGVTMTLAGEPGAPVTVTVERSTAGATAALSAALEEFNGAVRTMNAALGSAGGVLSRDPAATRLRQELVKALVAPVPGRPTDLDEAADAGVYRAVRARAVFSEEQLGSAARAERSGVGFVNPLRPAEDPPSVYNALDELGITAAEDDTFRLDAERFAAVLAARPAEVADLFTRAGQGIAARVMARVASELGDSGLLAMRRSAIEKLSRTEPGRDLADALAPDLRRMLLAALPTAP